MKRILILTVLLIIACVHNIYASPPSRTNTYTSGDTISSSEVTTNEDNIYTYLQGGVDTVKDNTITNADISTSANIQTNKINLTAIGASTFTSTIKATSTTNVGWTLATGADVACDDTCTNACIFGQDTDTGNIVACGTATSEICLCGGVE